MKLISLRSSKLKRQEVGEMREKRRVRAKHRIKELFAKQESPRAKVTERRKESMKRKKKSGIAIKSVQVKPHI